MVWNQRNNSVFNKPALNLVDVEDFVLNFLQDYNLQGGSKSWFASELCGSNPLRLSKFCKLPSAENFKLSVDASLDVKGIKIGMGAIISDSNGAIVAGLCSSYAEIFTPIYAEAMALHTALFCCVVVQFPIELVETDYQILDNKIKHKWKDRFSLFDLF
ncbi:hypothetical protein F8388_022515 [Cannabis sativa]|uniref:RNase H type-1 domain-containing protein n=1 Tax=Cannabis sativa TaxID=3483 RepID=A0A7J6EJY0_CANSA|nr:hypothetical protein F8388_022515 [Cannabis sativa]